MFYDVNGNSLNNGYSVAGAQLTVGYDVNGNRIEATPDEPEAPYSIDNVVSYYQQPTLAMASEINALPNNVVSFVILTDTHGSSNKQHSQNIASYLVRNTKADKLIHLGDVSSNLWSENEYRTYFSPLITDALKHMYFACGNHEWFNNNWSGLEVIYNDILSTKQNIVGYPAHFYYYFDDTAKKVRYMVINTSDGAANAVTNAQISWITTNVSNLPSDWRLIVFGHYDIMPNDPITNQWNSSSETKFTNAISAASCPIVGYFCGHEHHDRLVKVNNKFMQVTMLNDSFSRDTSFAEIVNPTRTAGTVSEQAASVVCVNLTTGAVEVKRIGAKNPDISMSYNFLT